MVKERTLRHRDRVAEIRIRNIPEAVRIALRRKALDEGMSMNTLVIQILAAAVNLKK